MLHVHPCYILKHLKSTAKEYVCTQLHTYTQTDMVVVISAHLPTEHSLFHAHVPLSATGASLSQDRVCGTFYWRL